MFHQKQNHKNCTVWFQNASSWVDLFFVWDDLPQSWGACSNRNQQDCNSRMNPYDVYNHRPFHGKTRRHTSAEKEMAANTWPKNVVKSFGAASCGITACECWWKAWVKSDPVTRKWLDVCKLSLWNRLWSFSEKLGQEHGWDLWISAMCSHKLWTSPVSMP